MKNRPDVDKIECPRCNGEGWVKRKKKRSLNQNRYYWIVVMIIASECGEDKDTMHEVLKYKFNSEKKVLPDNSVISYGKSTAKLPKEEFQIYLSTIKAWCRDDLNIIIPEPTQITDEMLIEMERRYNSMFY